MVPRQRPASARQARPPSAGPRRRVASARRRGAKDSHVLRLVGAPERPEDVSRHDIAAIWVAFFSHYGNPISLLTGG